MKDSDFFTIEYPSVRAFTTDIGKISHGNHYVRTLLEVDITDALQRLKEIRKSGRKVSLLAWFVKLLADSVARHPPINGIRKGRNKVIVFRDVDVSVIVERDVEGTPVPLPLVLRDTNHKTSAQLNDEIQKAVTQPIEHAGNLVLGSGQNPLLVKIALLIPQWLRLFYMRIFILSKPLRMQEMMGTITVTSLGTVGRISGWILPTSMHPLSIGIGTLNKKPVIYKGEIHKRDILNLTVTIDHDVIDGMPARAFVDDLVTRMEKAEGL